MRNFKSLLGFGVIAVALFSCTPETIPADADGNADGKYTINYAVQVVAVGDVTRGLNGATVTLQTQNGVTTKTVGADGIAVFEGLNAGTISGYVSAPGYASVNFKATAAAYNIDVNTNGYVTSTIYIPAKNSGIAGRLYADWDQDGNLTITDPGNVQVVDLKVRYNITAGYPMGTGDGMLTQVSLDYNTYASATDANGNYLIENLPNDDLGYFAATFKMDDVSLPDAVTIGAQRIWSYGPVAISLIPGEIDERGDTYIP